MNNPLASTTVVNNGLLITVVSNLNFVKTWKAAIESFPPDNATAILPLTPYLSTTLLIFPMKYFSKFTKENRIPDKTFYIKACINA